MQSTILYEKYRVKNSMHDVVFYEISLRKFEFLRYEQLLLQINYMYTIINTKAIGSFLCSQWVRGPSGRDSCCR